MSVVVKTVNYLRGHGLTHRQFQQFLEEFGEEYTDIPYHCEVRWLSKAKVLKRFFELSPAIVEFLKKKGKPKPMFEDLTWVADLAFLVDLTSHLNVLNISMQGEGHLITDLAEKISAFQRKLSLWKTQLSGENVAHFPTLESSVTENCNFAEYAKVIEQLEEQFSDRFEDLEKISVEPDIFSSPFHVQIGNVPAKYQLELIDLQSKRQLKDKFESATILQNFYLGFPQQDFPNLHCLAAQCLSMFGSTYVCERFFFSVMNLGKTRLRSNWSDINLRDNLRLCVTRTLTPNIGAINKGS